MDNNDLKPLIFLHPLSKTLSKLREVMSEDAEAEKIEVHDVESIDEASKLMPILGQSLILGASPKQCAMLLQKNKRFIKKSETKFMMLSSKSIPPRTLEKFMKLGLTESIVEPVNPKTLLYKVRLQLKSIITKREEGELELQRAKAKEKEQEKVSKRKERRMAIEDDKDEQEIVQKKISEKINSNYEGKSRKEKDEGGHESGENNYQEEDKSGHYKGSLASKKEKPQAKEDEDKPKSPDDELEDAVETEKLKKEEKLGGHYRGDFGSEDKQNESQGATSQLKENPVKKERATQEQAKGDDVELMKDIVDSVEKEKKEKEQRRMQPQDDSDDEDEEQSHSSLPEEKKGAMSGSSSTDNLGGDLGGKGSTDNLGGDLGGQGKTDHISNEENKGDVGKEEEIDGFLRGSLAQKEKEEQEGEDHNTPQLKKDNKKENNNSSSEETKKEEKPKKALAEKEQAEDTSRKRLALDIDEPIDEESKDGLDFEDENGNQEKEDKSDGQKSHNRKAFKEEKKGNLNGTGSPTENKKDQHNKSNAKSDKINTHYSSNSSTQHNEEDYGKDWSAQKHEIDKDFEKPSPQATPELDFEKEEEGDTLDYRTIQEEFAAIEYGSISKEDSHYEFEVAEAEVKTVNKTIVSPTGELVKMNFEKVEESEEESELKIYEPKSKDLEYIISILDTYYKKGAPPSHTLKKITKIAFNKHECDIVFYQFYNNKYSKLFNGFLHNRVTEPVRESFDQDSHYQEALMNYNDNKAIYDEEWNDIENDHLSFWSSCKIPTWSDPKFESEENNFVFPYYMGQRALGFAVVKPQARVNQENSNFIELLVESARGIYQTNKEKAVVEPKKESPKKKGVFKSLWGKLAG